MRSSATKEEKRAAWIIGGCAALVVLAMLGVSAFLTFAVSLPNFQPFISWPRDPGFPKVNPSPSIAPKWSDDGSHITFAIVTDPTARRTGSDDSGSRTFGAAQYVASADGSGVWQVERGFSAQPSRDGSRLVYATDRYRSAESRYGPINYEIETAAIDGSDRRRLTDDPLPDILPVWSPDGSQIAFVKHDGDYFYQGIYAMNNDGTGLRQVAPPNKYMREVDKSEIEVWDVSARGPAWSPAGNELAFVAEEVARIAGALDSWSLYAARPDGSETRRLLRVSSHARRDVNGSDQTFFSRRILSFPAWHPDGQTVAVITFEGDGSPSVWGDWSGGTFRIMEVGLDSFVREIISFDERINGKIPGVFFFPRGFRTKGESHVPSLEWSPDGSRLMFSSWGNDSTGGLFLVDADGENMRRIGDDPNATFSPDGSRIAAVSQRYSYSEPVLYTMDLNGSDIRPLVARGEDGKLKALNAPPSWWERVWDMVTP